MDSTGSISHRNTQNEGEEKTKNKIKTNRWEISQLALPHTHTQKLWNGIKAHCTYTVRLAMVKYTRVRTDWLRKTTISYHETNVEMLGESMEMRTKGTIMETMLYYCSFMRLKSWTGTEFIAAASNHWQLIEWWWKYPSVSCVHCIYLSLQKSCRMWMQIFCIIWYPSG